MADQSVAALIVSPANSPFLRRTLHAVLGQSHLPERIVLVRVGKESFPAVDGVEVIDAPGANNFGDAIREAVSADPSIMQAQWLWTLHDDSAPFEDALANLIAEGARGLTVGIVGPKQVAWSDSDRLLEVGVRASRSGRRLDYLMPGEIDQGQHDSDSDVLAVGTAGMLIRAAVWELTGGPDPVLGPFGDGLELCRRTRQLGYRTVFAPAAKIAHARGSYRDVRGGEEADVNRSFGLRRGAQLYNAMVANPPILFVLMLVSLPFWTLLRAIMRLFTKQPDLAWLELVGFARAFSRIPQAISARLRLARTRKVPAKALASLEESNLTITKAKRTLAKREREPKPVEVLEPVAAKLLREHKIASNVAAGVGTLLLLVAIFFTSSGLTNGITGGAWANLPTSFTKLWHEAWAGWVVGGAGAAGPSDPLLMVWALLSAPFALIGIGPKNVLVGFWLLAPLAAWLAMFWATSTLTHRPIWRFAFATIWISLPTFLLSWSDGRMAAVMVHVAVPLVLLGWMRMLSLGATLRIRGAQDGELEVQDRALATSYAALASAALVVVVAAAPWAGLALVLFTIVQLLVRPRKWKLTLLAATPPVAIMLPTWIAAVQIGGSRALRFLLADSGRPLAFDAPPTWLSVLGLPENLVLDPRSVGVWLALAPGVLCVLGATLALVNFSYAWLRTRFFYLTGAIAFIIAIVAARTVIAYDGTLVAAWPGPALSIAGICMIAAWSGLLRPLVLQERLYSYRSRRRLDVAAKRRLKAKERSQQNASKKDVLDEADAQVAQADVEQSEVDAAQSVDEIKPDESETQHLEVQAATPVPVLKSRVSALERVVWPLAAAGLVLTLVVALTPVAVWAAGITVDGARPRAITAAPEYETPAAAQYAQDYPRHARFLVMHVNDEGVQAQLRRGDGVELGDSSPRIRLEDAINMQYLPQGEVAQALANPDEADADFSRAVAEVLNNAEPTGLLGFAVDQIALSGEGTSYMAAQTALDSNEYLERAGESEAGLLWRMRPSGLEPARMYIDDSGKVTPVPSGLVGASVDLSKYKYGPGATLVLSERADANWRATVGAQLLDVADHGWQQAFKLDGANGVVKVAYHAEWMPIWWVLSALSVVSLLIAGAPIRRRRRQNEA